MEGRVGWGRDSPSSSGSVMPQPGHTQDTWPTAARGAGATLHRHRRNPTPWGSRLDGSADVERVGYPSSCNRSRRGPSHCLFVWLALKPSSPLVWASLAQVRIPPQFSLDGQREDDGLPAPSSWLRWAWPTPLGLRCIAGTEGPKGCGTIALPPTLASSSLTGCLEVPELQGVRPSHPPSCLTETCAESPSPAEASFSL